MITIGIKNDSNNVLPNYSTPGSSGFDLRANLDGDVTIPAGGRALIPTGLYFDIPEGYEIQVRPRSGLAIKYGITVLNTPGTVDSDYKGEVKIILINHGEDDFVISHGDRVAQGVVAKIEKVNLLSTQEIGESERSSGGFGHTGIK